MAFLVVPLAAFVVALIATRASMWLGWRWKLVDYPGGRRQHAGVIPRVGGLALYAGFVGALLLGRFLPANWQPASADPQEPLRWTGLIVIATFVAICGLLDDRFGFSARPQYLIQAAAGLLSVVFTLFIERLNNPLGSGQIVLPWPVIVFVTVLWFMGTMNTVNWLDGIDGLATTVTAIVALVLAVHMWRTGQQSVVPLALALLGAALGFLVFNWPPAKVFMGSVGAYFLGYTLAALGLIAGARVATVLLVIGLPVLDVAWLIIWRWRHGQPLGQGDRNHLHFRLLDKGFTPRQIVIGYALFCALFGLVSLMTASTEVKLLALLALLVAGGAIIWWASPRTNES